MLCFKTINKSLTTAEGLNCRTPQLGLLFDGMLFLATRPQVILHLSLSQTIGSQPPVHLYAHEGSLFELTAGRTHKVFLA